MVDMGMAEKDIGRRVSGIGMANFLAQRDDARAGIEDKSMAPGHHFNAGCIAAKSARVRTGGRITSAHAPKPQV